LDGLDQTTSATRKPFGETGARSKDNALADHPTLEEPTVLEIEQVRPGRLVDDSMTRLM
jgi:hypothetical protein